MHIFPPLRQRGFYAIRCISWYFLCIYKYVFIQYDKSTKYSHFSKMNFITKYFMHRAVSERCRYDGARGCIRRLCNFQKLMCYRILHDARRQLRMEENRSWMKELHPWRRISGLRDATFIFRDFHNVVQVIYDDK